MVSRQNSNGKNSIFSNQGVLPTENGESRFTKTPQPYTGGSNQRSNNINTIAYGEEISSPIQYGGSKKGITPGIKKNISLHRLSESHDPNT